MAINYLARDLDDCFYGRQRVVVYVRSSHYHITLCYDTRTVKHTARRSAYRRVIAPRNAIIPYEYLTIIVLYN